MRDVAEKVGVSVNSVSKALSDKPDISPRTRAAIIEAADRLGYEYRIAGRRKEGTQSRVVGLITSDNANPFFAPIVKGVQTTLRQAGYAMMLFNTEEDYAQERAAVELLVDQGAEGIILTPAQAKDEDIAYLESKGVPFVLLGRHFSTHPVPSILSDDRQGAYDAVAHLARLGHRRILFLNAPDYISSAHERREGYQRALEDAGAELDPTLIRQCPPTGQNAYNEMSAVLLEELDFTALFAFSDLMALGIVKLFQERSIRIPEDYSLVGFDDIDFVSLLSPPLTTVCQDRHNLGVQSAELLLRQLRGEPVEIVEKVLPTRLVVRASARRIV